METKQKTDWLFSNEHSQITDVLVYIPLSKIVKFIGRELITTKRQCEYLFLSRVGFKKQKILLKTGVGLQGRNQLLFRSMASG